MAVRNITIIDNIIYEDMISTQLKQRDKLKEYNKRCLDLHNYILKRKEFLNKLTCSVSINYLINILDDIEKIMTGE